MRYASPTRRITAALLDFLLIYASVIAGTIVGRYFALGGIAGLATILALIIWWLIVLKKGQTPGKQMLGIQSVRSNGQPTGFWLAFGRETIKRIVHLIPLIGVVLDLILMLTDKEEYCSISDRICRTVVVRYSPDHP